MKTITMIFTVVSALGLLSGHSPAQQRRDTTAYDKLYDAIENLTLDDANVAKVVNATIIRDAGTFLLRDGQIVLYKPVGGRTVAALFVGSGEFTMTPPTDVERKQLYRVYGVETMKQPFTFLFLLFTDTTLNELRRTCAFSTVDVSDKYESYTKGSLKYLLVEDAKYMDAHLALALLDAQHVPMFYGQFGEKTSRPFAFRIDPYSEEDIQFAQRADVRFWKYTETVTQFPCLAHAGHPGEKDLIAITGYRMNVAITDGLDFSAQATVQFTSCMDGVRWIPFRLYEKLEVDSLMWSGATRVAFFRHKENPTAWIMAPHPLAKGESCSFTVSYHGDLLERDEIGWIGLQSSSNWYPRYGYIQKSNYDITFHTPAKWQLACSGQRTDAATRGDTLITHWTSIRPGHNVSFTIGDFDEVTPEEKDSGARNDSLPRVTVLSFNSNKKAGNARLEGEVREDVLNSLRFFRHIYGPVPFPEFYATEIPFMHGEAFPGLIHLSWDTYKYADRYGRNEAFRAHEVAHQWWGVGVNFATYHDQWLSEGFSEYSGLWYMQVALKNNEKFFGVLDDAKKAILGNRKYTFGSGQEAGPIWLGYRTQSSLTNGDYDLIIYKKGAWVLHMLRMMMLDLKTMNEDRFTNVMREFYTTNLGRFASTADFQRVVEKNMGTDMTWFFNQWVVGTGIPSYTFAYRSEKTENGKYKVYCRVKQGNVPPEFHMPVPLLIKFGNDKFVRLRVQVSGEHPEFELPLLPLEPEEIIFNDLSSVLCEVDTESW